MQLPRLRDLSLSAALMLGLPALALVMLGFWLAYQFVRPEPPRTLVISTGSESGAYHAYARRYKEVLARDGIHLELRPSSGAIENLKRVSDPASDVMVAFVQGGIGDPETYPGLESVGAMYFEPLWVFHRGSARVDRLSQLLGKRLAVGADGSGTQELAVTLLAANGVTAGNTPFRALGSDAAVKALKRGEIDAALMVSGAESLLIKDLLREDGIQPANLLRAAAYVQRFPYLTELTLPQGSVDLVLDLPARDIKLVAPTANLVVRSDIHPALVELLMQALKEVHGGSGYFHKPGEFPSPRTQEFPLNRDAERFYRRGPPFLQRYLPFWAATLVERLWVMALPLIALVIPLTRILPPLYNWRMRSRIYRWYGELKYLERDVEQHFDPERRGEYLERLRHIEHQAMHRPVPLAFSEELYILREHIELVRRRLAERAPPPQGPA